MHFEGQPERICEELGHGKMRRDAGWSGRHKTLGVQRPAKPLQYKDNPPTPEEYLALSTRVVDLHPVTIMQNARTSGGERWTLSRMGRDRRACANYGERRISIWHAEIDNPFGQRATTYDSKDSRQRGSHPCLDCTQCAVQLLQGRNRHLRRRNALNDLNPIRSVESILHFQGN